MPNEREIRDALGLGPKHKPECAWCGHVVEEGEELADDPRPVVGEGKKVCHLCAASWEMM